MNRDITIGKETIKCEANALTPILYRQIFHRDFLREMQDLTALKGKTTETFTDKDLELYLDKQDAFSRLAFLMASQGAGMPVPELAKLGELDYFSWLAKFEIGAFESPETLAAIIGLWRANADDVQVKPKNA